MRNNFLAKMCIIQGGFCVFSHIFGGKCSFGLPKIGASIELKPLCLFQHNAGERAGRTNSRISIQDVISFMVQALLR